MTILLLINLHESMGPGLDQTRDHWICSQMRICSQTSYRLRYAARHILNILLSRIKLKTWHVNWLSRSIVNKQNTVKSSSNKSCFPLFSNQGYFMAALGVMLSVQSEP